VLAVARLRPSSLIEAPHLDQVDSEETPCGGERHTRLRRSRPLDTAIAYA
jgi:hypothetical protein